MRDQQGSSVANSASINSVTEVPSETSCSTWLTAAEAAQYLQIKTRTVHLWARCGRIKAYTLNGTKRRIWRFLYCDLDAFLIHSRPVLSSAQLSVRSTERRGR